MLETVRDMGPVLLIPAAWTAAAASVLGHLGNDGMLIAHTVMVGFISFFAITGWSAMSEGAFQAWRLVLVIGIPVTAAGLAGFVISTFETTLFAISLVGWMVLPAGGFVYTARELPAARRIYLWGALLSGLGAALAIGGIAVDDEQLVVAAIAVVGLGQTIGIIDASWRDRST